MYLCVLRINETLIDGTVDLLLDMPDQPLPCATAGRWQLICPLFLQARAQFSFPAALGPITLVARTQVFVERAVVLAGAGCDEVGYPHVNTHHGRTGACLDRHFLIVGEREPPHSLTLIELHAAVELSRLMGFGVRELLFVVCR